MSTRIGLSPNRIELAARVFKALSHPDRIRIASLLSAGPRSVTEIAAQLGIPQPMTSRHLIQMRRLGILSCRREGSRAEYAVAMPQVLGALDCMGRQPARRRES